MAIFTSHWMLYIRGGQLDKLWEAKLRQEPRIRKIKYVSPYCMASHSFSFKYGMLVVISYESASFKEYFTVLFTVSLVFISTKTGVITQSLQRQEQLTLASPCWCHMSGECAKPCARVSVCSRSQSGGGASIPLLTYQLRSGLWDSRWKLSCKMTETLWI